MYEFSELPQLERGYLDVETGEFVLFRDDPYNVLQHEKRTGRFAYLTQEQTEAVRNAKDEKNEG